MGLEQEEWYDAQPELLSKIRDFLDGDARFLIINAPTGSGKSLLAVAIQKMTGKRVHTVVSTKRLQDQMTNSYADVAILKGRNNYQCLIVPVPVDSAPCQIGFKCHLISVCPYFVDRTAATEDDYAVFNYPLYMSLKAHSKTWRHPDVLFADEAHLIYLELESFISTRITDREIAREKWQAPRVLTVQGLAQWADANILSARMNLDKAKNWVFAVTGKGGSIPQRQYSAAIRKYNHYLSLVRRLEMFVAAGMDDAAGKPWLVEKKGGLYQIRPVFVDNYSEHLFGGVDKVILMSATITPEDVARLGITDYEWVEVDSTFPIERRPVAYIPVTTLSARTERYELPKIVAAIDTIVDAHAAKRQKGIIHSVSYSRADEIVRLSRNSHLMMTHTPDNKDEVIRDFKNRSGPFVLVSPAVIEGEDFPNDDAHYVIVPKVPFKSLGDPVVAARSKLDPSWYSGAAVSDVIQASGRGMRGKDDYCNTYILDGAFERIYKKHQKDIPHWFAEAVEGI